MLVEAVQKPSGTRVLEQAELAQQGEGIASGVAHGCGTARQRPGAQVRGAFKIGRAGDKELAAPNGSVGARPRAIKGNAEHVRIGRELTPSDGLGHHARDMRMMMLNLNKRHVLFLRLFACPLTR